MTDPMTDKDVDEVVALLEEEAQRLSRHSLDRGSAEAGIAANLAYRAAALLESEHAGRLKAEKERDEANERTSAAVDDYNDELAARKAAERKIEQLREGLAAVVAEADRDTLAFRRARTLIKEMEGNEQTRG